MKKAKQFYDKMTDYKQYARVLLAVSAFFYLGFVIPTVEKTQSDMIMMMVLTTIFLVFSIIFFLLSKFYYKKLLELDEGLDLLDKK